MISAFARRTGPRERILRVDETAEGTTLQTGGPDASRATISDAPPSQFVESYADEGGTVHLSPMVDALRGWLARLRRADVSTSATENTTSEPPTERP